MVDSVNLLMSARVSFRPFKIIQGHWFWYQSKARSCDFLLVRVPGPFLHRFGDIAGFLCSSKFLTPTLFHPNLGGVPVICEQVP